MNRIAFVAVSISFALLGCRGDDTTGDDQPGMDSGSNAGDVTIQEVQNDAMASGTALELRGVVITAIDNFGDRTGDMFVSEPEGGAFSGVKVFGVSVADLALLQVGDLVDITNAEKHEACNAAAPCGSVVFPDDASITEVQGVTAGALTVTKVGTGAIPTPAVVDAKAIQALAKPERIAEWEKWEGVLIKVTNALQLSEAATFGSGTGPDSKEFRITGVARVQSVLTDMPTSAVIGTCYDSITGIGDFFFNNLILPRSEADFAGSGTSCNPVATTVVATQTATTPPELVNLTNVIVTGVDNIGTTMNADANKGFWVADAAAGAENNGIYVFLGTVASADMPAFLTIGAHVNVTGSATEFDLAPAGETLTEINASLTSISAGTGASVTPTPANPSPAITVLNALGATGEPWEGVLVSVGPVKLTNTALGGGKMELTGNGSGPPKLTMDDDAFKFADGVLTANNCYTVTGIMSVQVNDNLRTINPRSAADVVAATGCN